MEIRRAGPADAEAVENLPARFFSQEGFARHGLGAWYQGLRFTDTGRRILQVRL